MALAALRAHHFAAIFALPGVSGCSGIQSGLPGAYEVGSDFDHGVAVGSVGSLGRYQEWTSYTFRSKSNHELTGTVSSARFHDWPFNPLPNCDEDGLVDECGVLFALRLPAGEYEFFATSPAMDTRSSRSSPFEKPRDVILTNFNFVVEAGQVSYVGNMLSRICTRTTTWFADALTAVGDVADRYERDVPMLRAKFAPLETVQIVNRTMPGMPFVWSFREPADEEQLSEWLGDCSLGRSVAVEKAN